MPKILVTGGCGYIGSHTIISLLEHGFDVVSIDSLINSYEESLNGVAKITGKKVRNYNVDLTDKRALDSFFEQEREISGIIHFAALKSVGESVEKPVLYFQNNVISLINILGQAVKRNLDKFIFSSSCTVYGQATELPVTEGSPMKEAESPYGRTKQVGEYILLLAWSCHTEIQPPS